MTTLPSYNDGLDNGTATRRASVQLLSHPLQSPAPPSRRTSYHTRREAAPFEIQNDDADGESLAARYQMLEELGSGSFGVVYKAIERDTGEIVAIKHVDLESSEEDLSDILSELAVLSSCSSSHVTKYKLAFLRRQTLWIVMEYLGGGSCADLLKPPPHALNESHIAIICRELLLGLTYLHSEGKLHRDIKAANVLLGMDGRVKLADFGVAAQLTGLKSVRNTFVGTPFWMAPEVIQQEGHDAKADVWSLGITAMELANGQPPHANVHPMKVLFLIPKQSAPRLEGSQWSKDFKDFVAFCLTKDNDLRPTAKQMLKHRFVRNAGKIEGLQELIQRKQEWESSKGGDRNLKYYAETLRQLKKPAQSQDSDDWVFDTVRPVPAAEPQTYQTQKRRKAQRGSDLNFGEEATQMMEDLSLDSGTTRRNSARPDQFPEANSSVRRSGTKKKTLNVQSKQPLGVNMSFGNSPSTVRQFRRVSPNADQSTTEANAENEDPLRHLKVQSPLKLEFSENMLAVSDLPPLCLDRYAPPETPTRRQSGSKFSSQASTLAGSSSDTKEVIFGRKLYSHAVGIACQDVLNETGDQTKREAVAKLAEAFSDLETVDPEGIYHVIAGILGKMKEEPQLTQLLPIQPTSRKISIAEECSGTVQRTPSKASKPATSQNQTPVKLVMAQNNPHLKSHRRRQSTQVVNSREASQVWSPSSGIASPRTASATAAKSSEEREFDRLIKGVGMLEHTRQMADVMFERWCEGLRVRWPAV